MADVIAWLASLILALVILYQWVKILYKKTHRRK